MDKKELHTLLSKYRARTIDKDELSRLQLFLDTDQEKEWLEELWDVDFEPMCYVPDKDIKDRIFQNFSRDARIVSILPKQKVYTLNKFYRIAAVATLLLVGVFSLLWLNNDYLAQTFASHNTEVILPGSNKARIQFEDGTFIELDQITSDTIIADKGLHIFKAEDGSISYAYNINGSKTSELHNTIVTPRGGEYSLSLPDGSKVWLNAASKLKYPLTFNKSSREVELEGEAYFEVVKYNNEHGNVPFHVLSGKQKIEVLGTQFNVNTYGKTYKTTLIEGSVAMHYDGVTKSQVLKPSQQALYSTSTGVNTIQIVDPAYSVAWRSGKFAFDNASIHEVMNEIGRWYDVEVVFEGDLSQVRYSGSISRFEKFEQLLQLIEWTDLVTFKVQGRRITVMK